MRLAVWAAAFAAGIACALALSPTIVLALAIGAGLTSLLLVALRALNLALAVLAAAAGLVAASRAVDLAGAPSPVEEDRVSAVVGQVVRGSDVTEEAPGEAAPRESEAKRAGSPAPARAHLRIAVATVRERPVEATLSLTVLGGIPDVVPGDWVRFDTRLYLPRGFANPGLPDGRLLASGQGIDLVACLRGPSELQRADGEPGPTAYARRLAFLLRRRMAQAINHALSEPLAGFVRTMVVGERSSVPAPIEDGFRAAGATHVLSVSGLHLAVVVTLVFQGLRWLAGRFPAWALRCPPKVLASALALPVTAFYTLLTGEALATVRSALMAAIVLGAAIVNRPLSLPAGIGAAALVLLAQAPAALLDVSFQLSFASVIGLGLFARWLVPATRPSHGRVRRWLVRSLSASLAACLLTMPLVAHHFGEITPAAPIGNLLIVPVVEVIVLPLGLAGAVLGVIHPWLGVVPLWLAGWASHLALGIAELFRSYAPVWLVRCPSLVETLLLVATAALLLRGLGLETRRRSGWLLAGMLAATLAVGSMVVRDGARRSRAELRVTFLDVGQGDAVLVEGPGGFVALVDGGGRYDGSFDTGARIVEPVLRAAGITRLDLVVLSHPHPDHMNGLFRILERFPVTALWTNGDAGGNPAYAELIALARRQGVAVSAPVPLTHDQLQLEPLGPRWGERIAVPPGLHTNDASLVLRLHFGAQAILLTGDIGDEGEAELLDPATRPSALAADVLKVPHHGSRHASTPDFLRAVSPRLAVASVGRFNRFGLPSPGAVARYDALGIEVLRTDRAGAVTVGMDGRGDVTVICQRECLGQLRQAADPDGRAR